MGEGLSILLGLGSFSYIVNRDYDHILCWSVFYLYVHIVKATLLLLLQEGLCVLLEQYESRQSQLEGAVAAANELTKVLMKDLEQHQVAAEVSHRFSCHRISGRHSMFSPKWSSWNAKVVEGIMTWLRC
jgi:hypothetical protein